MLDESQIETCSNQNSLQEVSGVAHWVKVNQDYSERHSFCGQELVGGDIQGCFSLSWGLMTCSAVKWR